MQLVKDLLIETFISPLKPELKVQQTFLVFNTLKKEDILPFIFIIQTLDNLVL